MSENYESLSGVTAVLLWQDMVHYDHMTGKWSPGWWMKKTHGTVGPARASITKMKRDAVRYGGNPIPKWRLVQPDPENGGWKILEEG